MSATVEPAIVERDTTSLPGLRQRRLSLRKLALASGAVAALIGAAAFGQHWWTVGRFIQSTDDAYVGADVTPIAPHVAGFVQQILVKDHQRVDAGQQLMRLNPDDYAAALSHAEAVLQGKQAMLQSLAARLVLQRSIITGSAADLASRHAQAVFATQDADRYRTLATTFAGTRQEEQKALAADRSAKAAVLASQASLDGARQQVDVLETEVAAAKAEIAQAEADLRTARLNLGYTEVVSPVAGYVGNRSAQVGAYVSTGTNLLSIVPANGLWVDANFKEDQARAHAAGRSRHRGRRRFARAGVPRPCRQPRAGSRLRVQRHPDAERDWQLHQDRATRSRADQARRRRRATGRSARWPVHHGAR